MKNHCYHMKVAETHQSLKKDFENRFFGMKRKEKPSLTRCSIDLILKQTINVNTTRKSNQNYSFDRFHRGS